LLAQVVNYKTLKQLHGHWSVPDLVARLIASDSFVKRALTLQWCHFVERKLALDESIETDLGEDGFGQRG
jgi:hypothetical protein